jgi:hypothetical protein
MEEALWEPVFGWGGIGFSEKRSTIKKRIGRIMDTHYTSWKPITIGSLVLLCGIVILGFALSCSKKTETITSNAPAEKTTVQPQQKGSDSGLISSRTVVNEAPLPTFEVAQNYPNPFNPTTTISFTLFKAGKVTINIYDKTGKKVDTLVNAALNAGTHSVTWNASKFSAGIYFYTVRSGDYSKAMKMTLLK